MSVSNSDAMEICIREKGLLTIPQRSGDGLRDSLKLRKCAVPETNTCEDSISKAFACDENLLSGTLLMKPRRERTGNCLKHLKRKSGSENAWRWVHSNAGACSCVPLRAATMQGDRPAQNGSECRHDKNVGAGKRSSSVYEFVLQRTEMRTISGPGRGQLGELAGGKMGKR